MWGGVCRCIYVDVFRPNLEVIELNFTSLTSDNPYMIFDQEFRRLQGRSIN